MALGAEVRDVVGLVVREGFQWVAAGIIIGLIGARFMARLISGLL